MDIRRFFFKFRGFTPVPLVLFIFWFAHPTWFTFWTGLLIATVGELIRIWGVGHAGRATRTRNVDAENLVTSGPFRYVRNPLYLGNLLIYSGFTFLSGVWLPWSVILALILFIFQYYFIVSLEEEYLLDKFGPAYENYRNQVPRFFPRLVPWKDGTRIHIKLREPLQSERSTLIGYIIFPLAVLTRWYLFP